MIITVHSQHFNVTPSMKEFVVENLQHPLEQIWRGQGTTLEVSLRDLRGGDKQGIDKECRCIFHLPRGPRFVITEVTEDMRTSIHQARKRLLRRVRQHISQKVQVGRHHRKHYLADVADTTLIGRYARAQDVRGARETLH